MSRRLKLLKRIVQQAILNIASQATGLEAILDELTGDIQGLLDSGAFAGPPADRLRGKLNEISRDIALAGDSTRTFADNIGEAMNMLTNTDVQNKSRFTDLRTRSRSIIKF